MKVVYSSHLIERIKRRSFNEKDPRAIFYRPDNKYFDTIQNSNISIKNMFYNGKRQQIMIAFLYNKGLSSVIIKTIHVEIDQEINNRLKSGRYIKR